jgi:flagellar biosynthesis protein FlhF
MQIKRYEASSIQEAMDKIRKDLGQDAVILSTKRLKRGKSPLIEITAARDLNRSNCEKTAGSVSRPPHIIPDASRLPNQYATDQHMKTEISEIKQMLADLKKDNALRTELTELKETVNSLFDLIGLNKQEQGFFLSAYHQLVACGISRELAYKMMEQVKGQDGAVDGNGRIGIQRNIEDLLRKTLSVPEKKSKRRTMALIGPTGVGKTTTLAKLAAHYAIEERKRVGLIAADTYRIAATEQLKLYAKIMGLPIEIAAEKESFKKAMGKFSDLDMILIDTPGRNQTDEIHIREMADILNQAGPVNTSLLLSMTSSRENMLDAAHKFSVIPYDDIIFTKMDESVSCGSMYDVIEQIRKPVPYITNGQNVPKDIIKTNPDEIVRLIMGKQLN